jgi:hypothetical protein
MRDLWRPAECKIAANLYRTIEPGHGAHMRMLEQIAARLGRPVDGVNTRFRRRGPTFEGPRQSGGYTVNRDYRGSAPTHVNLDRRCAKPEACRVTVNHDLCASCRRAALYRASRRHAMVRRMRERGIVIDITVSQQPVGLFSAPIKEIAPQDRYLIDRFLQQRELAGQ